MQKIDIQKLDEAAEVLKAIAHPLRIAIIDLLVKKGNLTVTEIYKKLDSGQPTISHHLSILKSKGLLISERQGRQISYSLKHKRLNNIIKCINQCND